MPRKPHPFSQLGLTRSLTKFTLRDKREVIRKFLFGKNAHRYPVGKGGEEFNEFELDQILVFIAAMHLDDYVPTTFNRATDRIQKSRVADGTRALRAIQLDDGGSRHPEGRRGLLESQLDIDAVLDELNTRLDRGDSTPSSDEE